MQSSHVTCCADCPDRLPTSRLRCGATRGVYSTGLLPVYSSCQMCHNLLTEYVTNTFYSLIEEASDSSISDFLIFFFDTKHGSDNLCWSHPEND